MSTTLVLFVYSDIVLSLAPGPAVLMVIAIALTGGLRRSHAAIWGILLCNLLYFFASAAIIIFSASLRDEMFTIVRIIGAGYLIWTLAQQYMPLLLQTIQARNHLPESQESGESSQLFNASSPTKSYMNFFAAGFALSAANPKNIIYFTALLPQFIHAGLPIAPQFGILAILSVIIEYGILSIYALGASYLAKRADRSWQGILQHLGNLTVLIAVVWGIFFVDSSS